MVFVLIGVLVFSLWTGWLWLPAARRGPGLRADPAYGARPTGPLDLEGVVLLAERLGRRLVGLDCLMRDRRTSAPFVPVQIRASGATLFWGSASLDEVALRWIREEGHVGVDIVGTADHPRARIHRGESYLVLDIVDPAGLLRAARRSDSAADATSTG